MKKQITNEPKVRFIVSEPPFNYDPHSEGAMKKLNSANKTGLGDIEDEKPTRGYSKRVSAHRNTKPAARVVRTSKKATK
jgi:hypothetical protein